jgi:hypothetical protein
MTQVPLFDLKFLNELAATAAGASNRRHLCSLAAAGTVAGDLR